MPLLSRVTAEPIAGTSATGRPLASAGREGGSLHRRRKPRPNCFRSSEEHRISQTKRVRRNSEINSPQVRVIGPNGDQLGIMSIQEALRSAETSALDLVEVAP